MNDPADPKKWYFVWYELAILILWAIVIGLIRRKNE